MAKILGVQLKSRKTWEAREGLGCTANIYMDNKKIGTFYDAGDGGCVDINIDTPEARNELARRAKKYFEKYPFDTTGLDETKLDGKTFEEKYNFLVDTESFINEVDALYEREQFWKKQVKKGFKILLVCDYPFFASGPHPYIPMTMYGGKDPLRNVVNAISEHKKKWPLLKTKTYANPEDFIIE